MTLTNLIAFAIPVFADTAPARPSNFVRRENPPGYEWSLLKTDPYRGKQDDIFFINPEKGWYVNGAGKIYVTSDGGKTWEKIFEKPGTYFRCIGFVDELHGFAGNIGTDYFPAVTDETPLYETTDGGRSWKAVTNIVGPVAKGLCSIDILRTPFINAGKLDYRVTIHAAGRVGGPTIFLRSEDGGKSWQSKDIQSVCGMVLDVHFFTPKQGILCAASDAAVDKSNALILSTTDGGKTWDKVYQSERPYELTWKCSFPSDKVGYVTVQSYNPDKRVTKRFVAKTVDGGSSWYEIELTDDFSCREFGIAFADECTGWVGGMQTGYQTVDGGKSWTKTPMGMAVNKIRLLKSPKGLIGYAIGVQVYKLSSHPQSD